MGDRDNQISPEDVQRNQDAIRYKSEIIKKDITVLWKLAEMRTNWFIHMNSSSSQTLPVDLDGTVMRFKLDLSYDDDEGYKFLFIPPRDPPAPPSTKYLFGIVKVELLDHEGNVWLTESKGPYNWLDTNPEVDMYDQCHFGLRMTRQQLLSDQVLGEDDTLTIRITFTHHISRAVEYPNAPGLQEKASQAVDTMMTSQMEALLKDTSQADVQLKMKGGTVLQAHRLILSARSPVFKRMLEGDFVEKGGVVEIPDLSCTTMNVILHYIYTGKLHSDWRTDISEVLNGANRYDLQGLVQYCEYMIITLCNEFNAEDLLNIAKLHSLERATAEIEKFINGITV